jgi:hypothetical protein
MTPLSLCPAVVCCGSSRAWLRPSQGFSCCGLRKCIKTAGEAVAAAFPVGGCTSVCTFLWSGAFRSLAFMFVDCGIGSKEVGTMCWLAMYKVVD